MANEFEVFRGKKLDGLFKDIYDNQKTTKSQIGILIDILKPLIQTSTDAAIIVPLIRDYLDVSVANDAHLVRLAAIVQRLYATDKFSKTSGGEGMLSEAEKQKLYEDADKELKALSGEVKEDTKAIEEKSLVINDEIKKLTLNGDEQKSGDIE